jgi:hypothetical protein
MVPEPFSRNAVRKYWFLHDIAGALAMRQIERVEFVDGDMHRIHVKWARGDVWVNRGENDWEIQKHRLPQYGFYAYVEGEGAIFEAAIERQGTEVVEWSRGGEDNIYMNARAGSQAGVMFCASDGAFKISRDGQDLLITPLPESQPFSVQLGREAFRSDELVKEGDTFNLESINEEGQVAATEQLSVQKNQLTIPCKPGVFQYRVRKAAGH